MAWRRLVSIAIVFCGVLGCTRPAPPSEDIRAAPAQSVGIDKVALQSEPPLPAGGELDGFYRALSLLRGRNTSHIRIIQLGDSHTAADYFTGKLRDSLQSRFGDAGIGTRAAGLPYRGVRQKDMTISQSGRWLYHNSLTDHEFTRYGIAGFTAVSRSPGASLALTITDPRGFDRGFVEFARKPGGGVLEVWLDDILARRISTEGASGTVGFLRFAAPRGAAQRLKLVATAKGIEILSWNTERNDPGLLLDNFGIVGATIGVTESWNRNIVARELANLAPALVIIAYGTNEGAEPALDRAAYRASFRQLLDNIHRWAPRTSILVIGPPDGAHHDRRCAGTPTCPWVTLPSLDDVRQLQAREARASGAAFWDSAPPELRSGGIDRWVTFVPPLARPDHIHFTRDGYGLLATDLYRWLVDGWIAFQAAHASRANWP